MIGQTYECRAILYYPAASSSELETGIAWEEIQSGLSITGNSETGMIEIICEQSDSDASYNSTKGVVELFGTQMSKPF